MNDRNQSASEQWLEVRAPGYRKQPVHGEKWAYQLRDQLENFTHANSVLMRAIRLLQF